MLVIQWIIITRAIMVVIVMPAARVTLRGLTNGGLRLHRLSGAFTQKTPGNAKHLSSPHGQNGEDHQKLFGESGHERQL